jgi:hypothetical protein
VLLTVATEEQNPLAHNPLTHRISLRQKRYVSAETHAEKNWELPQFDLRILKRTEMGWKGILQPQERDLQGDGLNSRMVWRPWWGEPGKGKTGVLRLSLFASP